MAAAAIPESMSADMFRSNFEDIKSRFVVLLQSIQAALEANNVTKEAVRGMLVGMYPNCENCIPNTNMIEIFNAATRYKVWSYEHHSPVEKIVRRLLTSDHLCEVREYKSYLAGFFVTVKLIDYIKYTNIDSAVDGELDLEQLSVAHYQKLKVKLELDRKIDTLSLKYVQDLWEEFAEEFDIPYLTAVIGKILSGSLHITWLITSDMANKITTAVHGSSFFQNHPNIIYVAINDTVYYEGEKPTKSGGVEVERRVIRNIQQSTQAAGTSSEPQSSSIHRGSPRLHEVSYRRQSSNCCVS